MAVTGASEGFFSLLDTDLYKLNMQCAILKHFPSVEVEYTFTNRTSHMRLNRNAIVWLEEQTNKLESLRLEQSEFEYLQHHCKYLHEDYLRYLRSFSLRPKEQVRLSYEPTANDDFVDLGIQIKGLWVETILYEIPLLALTSEAYFRFVDLDWSHHKQESLAYEKGIRLLEAGCVVSEFGSRRRRDFRTQDHIVRGLVRAARENEGLPGKLMGTSNVYLAMKYGIDPIGTIAHEWFMAIAAISQDYEHANELGLKYWLDCYGEGVLGIALTDTFGSPNFFQAFAKQITGVAPPIGFEVKAHSCRSQDAAQQPTYAEVYTGIRQDSGNPKDYVIMAAAFYDSIGVKGKTIVFSDSLNVEKCIEYKAFAEKHDLKPTFGVGTIFTNEFSVKSNPTQKSRPLNIVMKVSKANGRACVKISDDIGKNTGDGNTIKHVKKRLGIDE